MTEAQEAAARHSGRPGSIRLDDFLKWTGKVRSGGEAKHRIQGGDVAVNGTVETHRCRKLVEGDEVSLDGVATRVAIPET